MAPSVAEPCKIMSYALIDNKARHLGSCDLLRATDMDGRRRESLGEIYSKIKRFVSCSKEV